MSADDTIAAIATPPGKGGIGIIRLSGAKSIEIAQQLTGRELPLRHAQYCEFRDGDGETLDQGIGLYFQKPHSFTGEDVVELQGHGGPVLLDMLLARVCELGARPARPGEFSERAFLNDKLDLTQAEAIADLIDSGSQAAARAAIRSLEGRFSAEIKTLVATVIELRAYIEAALDFSDEDIDFLADAAIGDRLEVLLGEIEAVLTEAEKGRLLQEGLRVVIAGQPNAGKSSLLNELAGYDAAIVTHVPGTTRDLISEQISLKGVPVHITDTAGLRESSDPVEQEGIRRAWREIDRADVILLLVDASQGMQSADHEILRQIQQRRENCRIERFFSKADLIEETVRETDSHYLSTQTREGLEVCIERITGKISDYNQDHEQVSARRRHVLALEAAQTALVQARDNFVHGLGPELIAEDLRQVQQCLNEITGEFNSEDLLGKIFSSFCIGK